jgi:hypothetical protein
MPQRAAACSISAAASAGHCAAATRSFCRNVLTDLPAAATAPLDSVGEMGWLPHDLRRSP